AFLTAFFERYVQFDFTAQLENQLDEISAGHIAWKQVLKDFWKDFYTNITEVKECEVTRILQTLESMLEHHLFPPVEGKDPHACPQCSNGRLNLRVGKFGFF